MLKRAGAIVAQALARPPEPVGGHEISLPHEGPTAREDMEACLAAVIDRSADGEALLIDSHVTEELESSMMRDVPGPPRILRTPGQRSSRSRCRAGRCRSRFPPH